MSLRDANPINADRSENATVDPAILIGWSLGIWRDELTRTLLTHLFRSVLAGLLLFPLLDASPAQAQLVAIGVDADVRLVGEDAAPPERVLPDQVIFYDFSGAAPRLLGTVEVPVSFQGPPIGIAITPDRRSAFVTSANGRNPVAPQEYIVTDTLSVIDLAGPAPRVVQTLHLGGEGTAAVLSPDGATLIVTHAGDDSATVLRVANGRAEPIAGLRFERGSHPLHAAFLPDGKTLAVTFGGGNFVGLFAVNGSRIAATPYRKITAGVFPVSIAVCGNTGLALVANYGTVSGDADTVSLIDLGGAVSRTIDTITVGPSPEGLDCTADGRYAVVSMQNGSTFDRADPRYKPNSELALLAIRNRHLVLLDRAPIGAWSEGLMFLDNDVIAAESVIDHRLHLFRRVGDKLTRLTPIEFPKGSPAAIGRAPDAVMSAR